eukprot:7225262-Pyramimonas_sp.AAC.1
MAAAIRRYLLLLEARVRLPELLLEVREPLLHAAPLKGADKSAEICDGALQRHRRAHPLLHRKRVEGEAARLFPLQARPRPLLLRHERVVAFSARSPLASSLLAPLVRAKRRVEHVRLRVERSGPSSDKVRGASRTDGGSHGAARVARIVQVSNEAVAGARWC